MEASTFKCSSCGRDFQVRADVLARFPGWKPAVCLDCKNGRAAKGPSKGTGKGPGKGAGRGARRPKKKRELGLSTAEVLERFTEGPQDGLFTDGACEGNPGPGGWGAVWVRSGEIVEERSGHEAHTTNNRMELAALIAGYELLPADAEVTVWSDSNLCVKTINEWAEGWRRRGWQRKDGPVKNLDLVRRLYELDRAHPNVKLRWIKAHDGSRWNEYADALATSYQRK